METKYYIVARIDGDYAWLNRTDAEEELLFIARALLPEAIPNLRVLVYDRPWNRDCVFPNGRYTRCFDWESIRRLVEHGGCPSGR